MQEDSIIQRVLHLKDVEKLSQRQIAKTLEIDRKRVSRILKAANVAASPTLKKTNLDGYLGLIAQWDQE